MLSARFLPIFLFLIFATVSAPYGHAATQPNVSAYPTTVGFPTGMIKFGYSTTTLIPLNATIHWGDGDTSAALKDCIYLSGLNKYQCDYWGHQHTYKSTNNNKPYTITVTADIGQVAKFSLPVVPIGNFVIVSIGDSVASGEGNPVVPVKTTACCGHKAYWNYGDASISNLTHTKTAHACHGSSESGPAIAARTIIHDNPSARVTFIHLACSGAHIYIKHAKGDLGNYDTSTTDNPDNAVGQLDHLATLLPKGTKIDTLLITVGADNIDGGFGNVVKACVGSPPDPKIDCTTSTDTASVAMRESLPSIPSLDYSPLEAKLKSGILNVADSNVYITDYFDPTHDAAGNFPTLEESKACSAETLLPDEFEYLYYNLQVPLNARIATIKDLYGWHYIGGKDFPIASDFLDHGYCVASGSWVVSLPQSVATQGNKDGTSHPNPQGQNEYKNNIVKAIYRWTLPVTTATATTSSQAYTFGQWTHGDVAVTLSAKNKLEKAGTGNTYFSVDNAACSGTDTGSCSIYSAPFSIAAPGIHTVYFFTATAPSDTTIPTAFEKVKTVQVQIDKPSASDGSASTRIGQAVSGQLQASNPQSGDTLTYNIVTQPSHGTVSLTDANKGTFTYTPGSGYDGNDSFTFLANNGFSNSNTATESVSVADDAPVAKDGSVNSTANKAVTGQLQASDPDSGDTLTFNIVTQPGHGTVSLSDVNSGTFNYTPDSGYVGDDSFTFNVKDGSAGSNTATESVSVASGTVQPSSGGGAAVPASNGGGALNPIVLLMLLGLGGLRRVGRSEPKH